MSISLAVQLGTTDTTITVKGQIADASGPGTLTIDSEQISYTGNSVNQFLGCVRGYNGSTAAIHLISAPISYRMNSLTGSLSFQNVAANIGSVSNATQASTIFTPLVTGMYLLSFYGIATAPVGGSDAAPNLYMAWTDEHGVQKNFTYAGNLDPVYSDGANQLTIPISAQAGTPVWMATTAGVYATSLRFSFYFKVTPA